MAFEYCQVKSQPNLGYDVSVLCCIFINALQIFRTRELFHFDLDTRAICLSKERGLAFMCFVLSIDF